MRETRVSTYRWYIFLVLGLAYFFVYFHRLSLSVVANDLAREFAASASTMGFLGSVYFYCYALMQFPAGLLSDSLGPRKTVTCSLLVASAGSVVFGLAPTMTVAVLGRVMVGLGVSMVFIPTMKILSQWFRVREFALMAGLLNGVGGAGVLGATWMLALLTAWVGWRVAFDMIGVTTLVLVGLTWLVVRDRPEEKGWPAVVPGGTGAAADGISLWEGARRVVAEPYFWPVAIWFFLDCGIFFGFGALWSGPYLMDIYGMSRAEAGGVLSMIAWGMIGGSPLLGYLSDRVFRSRKKVCLLCGGLLSLLLLLMVLRPAGLPRPALFAFFLGFSVCASAIVVIGFTTAKELFPVQIAGTSVGAVNFFPFLGGAVFMPVLGRVLDTYPRAASGAYPIEAYRNMLLFLLAASILALVCALAMKETFRDA